MRTYIINGWESPMSLAFSLRQLYHLVANPFEPARAELRRPEDIVIVGEGHRKALDMITSLLLEHEYPYLVILQGDWGTGKTAIIKKAIYELNRRIGDKLLAIHFRIPRTEEGIPLDEVVFYLVIELYKIAEKANITLDKYIKNTIESWEKQEEISEEERRKARDLLFEILKAALKQGKKVLIAIDQFENLKITKKNDENFLFLLREIFDEIGKHGQIVVVLSALTMRLREMYDTEVWGKFIRATRIAQVGYLTRGDVLILFRTLLEKFREPEFQGEPLTPFTVEAIEEIWRLANRTPGRIYDISSNILSMAARKGIEKIDGTIVRYLVGEYDFKWIDAIEKMPYMQLHELIRNLLEASRKLLDVIYIQTDVITSDNYSSFLRLKREIKDEESEELINCWRRGANFFIYYRADDRDKLCIVKVSEKLIRRDAIEYLHRALSLSTPIFMNKPIPPIDTSIVLITSGRITSQARYSARGLEVAFGVRVREKMIDTTEPRSYGRIRALVEEIDEIEKIHGDLYSAPEEDLLKVKEEAIKVLRFLGIVIGAE